MKKPYEAPKVLAHQPISFETTQSGKRKKKDD